MTYRPLAVMVGLDPATYSILALSPAGTDARGKPGMAMRVTNNEVWY
jgi:hypothetical protein